MNKLGKKLIKAMKEGIKAARCKDTAPMFECPECGADLAIEGHKDGCNWTNREADKDY